MADDETRVAAMLRVSQFGWRPVTAAGCHRGFQMAGWINGWRAAKS